MAIILTAKGCQKQRREVWKEFIMGTEMGILSMSPVVTGPEGIRLRAERALDAMPAVPRDAS